MTTASSLSSRVRVGVSWEVCRVAVHDAIFNKSQWGAWFSRMIAGG